MKGFSGVRRMLCMLALVAMAAAPRGGASAPTTDRADSSRRLAERLLERFPAHPPSSCEEFSSTMRTFSAITSAVVGAGDDERAGCMTVVDSVRAVMLDTPDALRPLFAPVWSGTAFCALRLGRRADAHADLAEGVAALTALDPVIADFMADPEAALEGLPPEEHCRILVTLMSSVAGTRSLSMLSNELLDGSTSERIIGLRRLAEDLEARRERLGPVEQIVAKLFE